MNVDRSAIGRSIDRDTVRYASKLAFAAVSVLFVTYLLTLLPGADRVSVPVTFGALVAAIVTVGLVVVLLATAPRLATFTRRRLDGPESIVENLASIVYWLVVLVAVLLAHRGVAGVIEPLLGSVAWVYDLAFLLLALPAVVVIAARLYATLDPGANLVADRVARTED